MTLYRCYRCGAPLRAGRSLCRRCWRLLFRRCLEGWDSAQRRNGYQRWQRWRRQNPPR